LALNKNSHADVIRQAAYDGLTELADPKSFPLVEKGARYGAPPLARAAALRNAGELGKRHAALRKPALDLMTAVAEHRHNPAGTFRGKMAALRALENLSDLEALPVLRRVQEREADGRIVRLARNVANAVRQGASKPQELFTFRTDLDAAVKENKALRDRMETLEQKVEPKQGEEAEESGAKAASPAARSASAPRSKRSAAVLPAPRGKRSATSRRAAAASRAATRKTVRKAAPRKPARRAAKPARGKRRR
jgi:hypothetical protein